MRKRRIDNQGHITLYKQTLRFNRAYNGYRACVAHLCLCAFSSNILQYLKLEFLHSIKYLKIIGKNETKMAKFVI